MRTTLSQSPIGDFAPPVIINVVYGFARLVSVVLGHPQAGVFATQTYPFPAEVRATVAFRPMVTRISRAWGAYLLCRSGLRLRRCARAGLPVEHVNGAILWSLL